MIFKRVLQVFGEHCIQMLSLQSCSDSKPIMSWVHLGCKHKLQWLPTAQNTLQLKGYLLSQYELQIPKCKIIFSSRGKLAEAAHLESLEYERSLSQSFHLMTPFGSHSLLICDFELKCYKVKDNEDDFIKARLSQDGIQMPRDHVRNITFN